MVDYSKEESFAKSKCRLLSVIEHLDSSFLEKAARHHMQDGSTLTAAYLSGSEVVISHLGDSAAFMIKKDGKYTKLTTDHTPASTSEAKRIRNAGG